MTEDNLKIWNNYCHCIVGMGIYSLRRRGPTHRATHRAFVNNLRVIADHMENLLTQDKPTPQPAVEPKKAI